MLVIASIPVSSEQPRHLNEPRTTNVSTNPRTEDDSIPRNVPPSGHSMHIHALSNRLRAALPRPLWETIRKTANAALGPLHFSIETGHLRSALMSRAVDRHGEPLPWYTYPAIQFLLPKDFSGKRVLEWGAGQSTLFWAERAKQLVSFESDERWHRRLTARGLSNATIHLVDDHRAAAESLLANERFDVIIVDGLDRGNCARLSLGLLALDGAIILDDAERNPGRGGYGGGCIELYRAAGLSRIDFYGYSPGNTTQHCTSLFFKSECFLLRGGEVPEVTLSLWAIR
jgi:hypothetical protein